MVRPKGQPKTGGRVAGTPNAVTKEVREILKAFVTDNSEEVQRLWEGIDNLEKKLKVYLEICSFVLPKPQSIQLEASVNRVSDVEEDLRRLAEDN